MRKPAIGVQVVRGAREKGAVPVQPCDDLRAATSCLNSPVICEKDLDHEFEVAINGRKDT